MHNSISAIWTAPPPENILETIHDILFDAGRKHDQIRVFFRADDIALADEHFHRMMGIFHAQQIPLCLAVVPQWLTAERWREMEQFSPENPLWCWHQHGWNHTNHETAGKKSEFGPARSSEEIRNDLLHGRKHLTAVLGELFQPVFTPPWNRCTTTTLELLEELEFQAVSRSKNAKPPYDGKLPDLAVNVDLHTRRETDPLEGWNNLVTEISSAADAGRIGIMLHHQRMNDAAYTFLSLLLRIIKEHHEVTCVTFRELINIRG